MTDDTLTFDEDPVLFDVDESHDLQSAKVLATRRHIRRDAKLELRRAMNDENAAEIITSIPAPGEAWHIIGNGSFDYWTLVPRMLAFMGPSAFHGSTWTMNRGNALELLDLLDQGTITSAALLTGTYFKQREAAVYATVAEGLLKRGQRFMAFENHAKIVLLDDGVNHIVMEGSANFTANPRVEQYMIANDPDLLAFHREWMVEALNG